MSIQSPIIETVSATWLSQVTPGKHRILGLDIGTKTIGTAITSPDWSVVTPLITIQRGKTWQADLLLFNKALAEFPVGAVIIGLPLNMDGSEGPRAQSTRQTAVNLQNAQAAWLQAPGLIGFWDERLSTAAATRFMIDTLDAKRSKRAEVIDALAAQHILQGAMDYLNNQRTKPHGHL